MLGRVVKVFSLAASVALLFVAAAVPVRGQQDDGKTIEFNRDVRPILANNCLKCHGHDPKSVMMGLRLDKREVATKPLSDGKIAIVPGHPEKSELIRRINLDNDDRMPPPDTHKILSADDKATLAKWIEEGAEYKEHWAFVPPVRYPAPAVKDTAWPKNDIDRFILAGIEKKGLHPSPEADRATLLRRVSFDLTGLPPTPEELQAFENDPSPNAYEKQVDRLLASSRYGERMAMDWLDIARYADSNGYQADYERFQWRWRDWVIDAFNKNLPYDQFIVKQLAGDLLPNHTLDDVMATGFNRNHRINTEGGVIAEEWRVENVIDRVETTSEAFLGLTAGCARCHDHKFDPISQKDFYSLFAYFNNVSESGTGVEQPVNHPPLIKAPTSVQETQLKSANDRLRALDESVDAYLVRHEDQAQDWHVEDKAWPSSLSSSLVGRWALSDKPRVTASAHWLPIPKPVGKVVSNFGRSTGAIVTGPDTQVELGDVGDFEKTDSFSYGAWVYSEDGNGAALARMDAPHDYRGWDIYFAGGTPMVHILSHWPDNALKVTSKTMVPLKKWVHVLVTYDGSAKPNGVKLYLDGKAVETVTEKDTLTGSIRTTVPMMVGRRVGGETFKGMVDDPVVFNRALKPEEVAAIADVNPAKPLLSIPVGSRKPEQKKEITRQWGMAHDSDFAKTLAREDAARRERDRIDASIPTLMVMDEMKKPRDCYVLVRGQYDHHGDKVTASTPGFLPPLPKGAPNNRLGLAEWIASPTNPLTARVTVNRWWERLFGTGIVSTVEDFGTRAEFPSHPRLLDWLATEFVRLHWNVKAMLKEIVMSATYRQSSAVTPEMLKVDPLNRLLERGPRFRLPAEMIRDQALAVSGLLFNKTGGPSVYPYMPPGIWDETNFYGNLRDYRNQHGADLYRRSLYTIWKRTAAPPNMLLFDAPTRETCRMSRARTDTPLQALDLMNDVTYLEAARVLAQNVLRGAQTQSANRTADLRFSGVDANAAGKPSTNAEVPVRLAFERVLLREPTERELSILVDGFQKRLAKYQVDPKATDSLCSEGEYPLDKSLDRPTLAAMTVVCSTLLNLDETVTKE